MTTIPIPESALSPESATLLAEWAHGNGEQERNVDEDDG